MPSDPNLPEVNSFHINGKEQIHAITENGPEVLERGSLEDARALYLRYAPISAIANITGLEKSVLRALVQAPGGWKEEREKSAKEAKEEAKAGHLTVLRKVTAHSLNIIERALEAYDKCLKLEGKDPSLLEGEVVAGIFAKLHRAKLGEEAENLNPDSQGLTQEEILLAITQDPYLRIALESRTKIQESSSEVYEPKEEDVTENADTGSLAHPNR